MHLREFITVALFVSAILAVYILAITGVCCFLYGYFVEPYWIEVKKVEIRTEKLSHAKIRIVQISDLHCDLKIRDEKKLAEIINPLKPDVIVFTGDTANSYKALPLFQETLKNLKAGMGKFAVTGNYDYWFLRGVDLFKDTDFYPLDRKTVKLTKDGEDFYVSGVNFGREAGWHRLLEEVPAGYYSIFLYHKPDLIEDLKGVNVDLYLAGHTHGGQIALPFYGALMTLSKYGKKYESGEYAVDKTVLYVNRGIGMEGKAFFRVRFFARPEITVFDIMPEKQVGRGI